MKQESLNRLYNSGIVSELDIHFASFISRLAGTRAPELCLAAALASHYTRQGHVCLALSSIAGKPLVEGENGHDPIICPALRDWHKKLRKTSVVGKPGEYKPLILDDRSGLYLYRYWDYQEKLANLIRERVNEDEENINFTHLRERLDRLFPKGQDVDWQKVAAFTSLVKKFCIISGGPGTGKTTTVAKILALILEQPSPTTPRIALTAPTGKAAAKLQQAIKHSKANLTCAESIKDAIPEKASTIHRLLGSVPGSPYFRHNAQNMLPVDIVVVDEASMVDLALMSKLIQAIPPQARLILLGDKDQLASVEAGAMLGDICDTGHVHSFSRRFSNHLKKVTGYKIATQPNAGDESAIQDCIIQLQKNFRFGPDSGIRTLSRAVNVGDADLAVSLLVEGNCGDTKWVSLPKPNVLPQAIREKIIDGFGEYLKASDVSEIFQLFDRFRILCALRKGPFGVTSVNRLVEQTLKEEGLIEPDTRRYRGCPVLITRNDYNLRLFNGDVGIVLPDSEANNDLRAFFPGEDGMLRKFHPLRLPEHETVYAMTVHKSQGSEFDKVLLVLPDKEFPVLTRELIYTGITRAKESIEIWGVENVFRAAVSRRIERMSGLRHALVTAAAHSGCNRTKGPKKNEKVFL